MAQISINGGQKVLDVRGGVSLLRALKNWGIFVPSACGGRAVCGFCKVKVLSGAPQEVSAIERPFLSEADIRLGMRLSCQLPVRADMEIELPEALLAGRRYRGILESFRNLTADIRELRIRVVQPRRLDFVPGQYIQLECPGFEGRGPVTRAFSVSSTPEDRGFVELIVRMVPGGTCTTWIFNGLNPGDEVEFSGPYGEFGITDLGSPMIWIAGGSGMAPFWSMVRHMRQGHISRRCQYFFGAVRQEDLYFVGPLRAMTQDMPNFEFVPCVSEATSDWPGEKGLVTEVAQRRTGDLSEYEGYLCGSPAMVDMCVEILRDKGMPQERIFFDKYA